MAAAAVCKHIRGIGREEQQLSIQGEFPKHLVVACLRMVDLLIGMR